MMSPPRSWGPCVLSHTARLGHGMTTGLDLLARRVAAVELPLLPLLCLLRDQTRPDQHRRRAR